MFIKLTPVSVVNTVLVSEIYHLLCKIVREGPRGPFSVWGILGGGGLGLSVAEFRKLSDFQRLGGTRSDVIR